MLEDQVAFLLQKYLGNYVRGLSKEALKISVWRGEDSVRSPSLTFPVHTPSLESTRNASLVWLTVFVRLIPGVKRLRLIWFVILVRRRGVACL